MNKLLALVFIMFLASCKHETTIHPERKNIVETVYASGKITAENEYSLFALSNGTVVKKLVKEGDTVKKGQVIYIINNDAPAAKLDAARSNFENAQSNISDQSRVLKDLKLSMQSAETRYENDSLQYIRLKKLLDQGIGTQNNLDNARATALISENQKKSAEEKYYSTLNDLHVNYQNAKSQLTGAKTDLDNYFIRAEENGLVFQTMKEQGEAVKLNEAVALLGETKSRLIRLAVDQQDISRLKIGQEVLLKTDVTGSTIYKASISKIYPTMNETDQTFRVDAVFLDNTDQHYIHSSVEANIIIQKKNNVLVVPRQALVSDDSVQVKESGKIKTVAVKTGIHTLNDVEIIEGLNESSSIVLTQK
ncbi:MAG: HlyD family efflux transporter periplasmic adaptor subunit [Bacteroidetes bacterium]|nr:HlyD family efflux transporter periplasmic adaptor subunit [Bacteroidota bacterium]